jgi:regulation of enolase protein 1 (concanavalin A-like superfamily)
MIGHQRFQKALSSAIGLIALSVLLLMAPPMATQGAEHRVFFHSGFDSDTLDPGLTLLRENPSFYSLTERPGYFRLKTQKQSLNTYPQTPPTTENILLTACPDEDFVVETFMEFVPTLAYHQAGLVIYEDDDHFIKFASAINPGLPQPRFFQFYTQNGAETTYTNLAANLNQVYLRIERVGDTYAGYYSSDGTTYVLVDAFTNPLETPSAGFIGENGSIGTATPAIADYDYLTLKLRFALMETVRSFTLVWSSTVGNTYRVQWRDNLLTQEWTDISEAIVATDTVSRWTDYGDEVTGRPAPGWSEVSQAYYRVVEE